MASMYLAARQARQQNDTLSSSISNGTDSGLDPDALAAMQDGTIRVQQLIESVGLVAWDMSRRESLNQGCVINCTSDSDSDMPPPPPPPPPPAPVPVCGNGGYVVMGGMSSAALQIRIRIWSSPHLHPQPSTCAGMW